MRTPHPIRNLTRRAPHLASILDNIIHPTRPDPDPDSDPGRPFTPPPPPRSRKEREDDDNDGPGFPMNPALA